MAVKDEFRLNLYYLTKLITKYPRILVYAPYGSGKATLMKSLEKKFPEVNFYPSMGWPVKVPFVCSLLDPDNERIPEFDRIYCIQYSTEYKEAQTGYRFPPGEYHSIGDYVKKVKEEKRSRYNLSGKTFGSLDQLREAIS